MEKRRGKFQAERSTWPQWKGNRSIPVVILRDVSSHQEDKQLGQTGVTDNKDRILQVPEDSGEVCLQHTGCQYKKSDVNHCFRETFILPKIDLDLIHVISSSVHSAPKIKSNRKWRI